MYLPIPRTRNSYGFHMKIHCSSLIYTWHIVFNVVFVVGSDIRTVYLSSKHRKIIYRYVKNLENISHVLTPSDAFP